VSEAGGLTSCLIAVLTISISLSTIMKINSLKSVR
jgi:hypothetical protein